MEDRQILFMMVASNPVYPKQLDPVRRMDKGKKTQNSISGCHIEFGIVCDGCLVDTIKVQTMTVCLDREVHGRKQCCFYFISSNFTVFTDRQQ